MHEALPFPVLLAETISIYLEEVRNIFALFLNLSGITFRHRECSHTPENAALPRLAFMLVGIVPNPYEATGKDGE